jgi:uncharacterized protein
VSEPALYTGTLTHRRMGPVDRSFALPLRMVSVDVDALPGALDGLPLWSARRPAPVWLRRADYGDGGPGPLGAFVRELVAERTGTVPAGPVRMLTLPRTLGYVFNPLTVYCCGAPGTPGEKVVLEVTNTPWKERHWYVLDGARARDGRFAKALHVSPFLPSDGTYRVELEGPGEMLRLGLALEREGRTLFAARLDLRRRPLTRRAAAGMALDRPLATYAVWAQIHRRALGLWASRVPFVPHPRRRVGAPA